LPLFAGEKFPYVFKAALRAAREGHFARRPRLAASLPARAGGGHRETGGHAEAPGVLTIEEAGPLPDRHRRAMGRRGADRSGTGPHAARARLRRAGPPALRPGQGLRRPGLRPWTRATPGCSARPDVLRTGGHQTASAWSRSFVRRGAPPGPAGRGPAEQSLRDGMPAQPTGSHRSAEYASRSLGTSTVKLRPETSRNQRQSMSGICPAQRPLGCRPPRSESTQDRFELYYNV